MSSTTLPLRLAYADPPYPGKAHLYRDHSDYAGEVDHAELVARLKRDYDGWALSTDERNLRFVLSLCPEDVRVLAWCRRNSTPFHPYPYAAWEPVICRPARSVGVTPVRNYIEANAPVARWQKTPIPGQKPAEFCEWVIRCLGAEPGDTLDDLFPGSGVMAQTFDLFQRQPPLFRHRENKARAASQRTNLWRSVSDPLPGMEAPKRIPERRYKRGEAA